MKPEKPLVYNEFYLDAMTGGETFPPTPVTREQHFLAKLAGLTVDVPQPVTLREKFLAKACEMDVDVPTYTAGLPRIYSWLAKAAGQDVETPTPITREELYWDEYTSVHEYELSGIPPLTFRSNGTPLLDLLISGNEEHSGTPTPDSPVMTQGTGERTGNLCDFNALKNAASGIIYTLGGTSYSVSHLLTLELKPDTTYILSSNYQKTENKQNIIYLAYADVRYSVNSENSPTFTTDSSGILKIGFYDNRVGSDDFLNGTAYLMLNAGSTALPYEPFGIKIPISSANTTTPVYLGEVQTTRKIRKLVLTGEEDWGTYASVSNAYRVSTSSIGMNRMSGTSGYSTHYARVTSTSELVSGTFNFGASYFYICDDNCTSKDDFKTYLQQQYAAGTPVCVWYVLATEETAVVNEPLQKIGDYADTLSMEQAGVQIPTAKGSTTLDVETTVKPSEVYIKYKE